MMRLEQLLGGQKPRLVMFDLDGTLVDSVPDLAAAVDDMLLQLGRPAVGIDLVRTWVGNGAPMLVRRALSRRLEPDPFHEPEVTRALALFTQAYAQHQGQTRLYPGVQSVLMQLRQWKIDLALITNKPEQFIHPLLESVGLDGLFRWIVGGDTLPQQKPDPAGLVHVMALAGVSPDQALFVGDSCNDIRAAKAAQVCSVAMTYGYNHGHPISDEHPDCLLDDLRDLLRLVD